MIKKVGENAYKIYTSTGRVKSEELFSTYEEADKKEKLIHYKYLQKSVARDLCYPKNILSEIDKCENEIQVDRIMIHCRKTS